MKLIKNLLVSLLYVGLPLIVIADLLICAGKDENKSVVQITKSILTELKEIRES